MLLVIKLLLHSVVTIDFLTKTVTALDITEPILLLLVITHSFSIFIFILVDISE